MRLRSLGALVLIGLAATVGAIGQELRFAHLGVCPLQSGQSIQDCQIGYRTFGTLSENKRNAILFPTWALGTTEQAIALVGPGRLLDSSKHFVILVDSLSNGVSSSPSNSSLQPRMEFPLITIADMVRADHLLVTKELKLDHLSAVIGQSMGGMQVFQWMVQYPTFMDRAVSIIGSPQLAPYDLLLWQTEIDAIKRDPGWRGGDYDHNPAETAEAEIAELTLMTPDWVNQQNTRSSIGKAVAATATASPADANNRIRQCEAMMSMDVARDFGGSLQAAAAHVKTRAFVIVSKRDHTVTPQPAIDFAKLINAKPLVLDSVCGHMAPLCELNLITKEVNVFLEQ
jgi:homoserine O-acetyltransferase/O-succinyltransferase